MKTELFWNIGLNFPAIGFIFIMDRRHQSSVGISTTTRGIVNIMKPFFVFSGQGAQFAGMGRDTAENSAAARAISAGDDVAFDLETGEIVDVTTGQTFAAAPFPPFMLELIAAGGLANFLCKR